MSIETSTDETPTDGGESFEVFEDEAGGWAVRRAGEPETLTRHDTRQQAEKAARLHSIEQVGAEIRQDIFTNDPEQAVRAPREPIVLGLGAAVLAVALVVAIIALTG
jgi:hypothetical protein